MLLMIIMFILGTILVSAGLLALKGITPRQLAFLGKAAALFAVSSVVVVLLACLIVFLF